MQRRFLGAALVWFAVGACAAPLSAADPEPTPIAELKRAEPVHFEKEVLPILKRSCLACHNAAQKESDLVLETPQTILKGGASGPAVEPKKPDDSMLLLVAAFMSDPIMPPPNNKVNAPKLTSQELGLIKQWILEGATGEVSGAASAITWQSLPAGVNPIYAVAVTADGQYAAAGRANQIFIYHIPTGREIGRLTDPELLKGGVYSNPGVAHLDLVQALKFDPAGRRLASGGFQEVKIWRQPENVQLSKFAAPEAAAAVAVSPDRKLLAAAAGNDVRTWDLTTGKEGRTFAGHADAVLAVRFSADGQKLVTGSADRSLRIWNLADGAAVGRIDTPQPVAALTLLRTGEEIATGGGDNAIRVWTTPAGPAPSLEGLPAPVTALAASPDRKWIAAGGSDGKIVLLDGASGAVVRTLAGHSGAITSLSFNASNNRLASGSADKTLRIWDVNADQALVVVPAGLEGVDAVAVNAAGNQAAAAAGPGNIGIFKLDAAAPRKFNGDNGTPAAVAAVSNDGRFLLVPGTSEGKPAAILYDIASGNIVRALVGHEGPVTAVAFSADNTKAITGSEDKTARVWNVADGAAVGTFSAHAQPVTVVALNSNGTQAAAGYRDNALKLWNPADGAEVHNLAGHTGALTGVAYTTDNAQVLSTSVDGTLRWWKSADAGQVRSVALGAAGTALALSRDNKYAAVAGADNVVRMYQIGDGAEYARLAGHGAAVGSLAFSNDHLRLVSGGADNQALVWDVAGKKLLEIAPLDKLTAAAFGPAPNTLLLADGDKAIALHTLRFHAAGAGLAKSVDKLIYSPDGGTLFAAGEEGLIVGIQTANGQPRFTANQGAPVHDLALSVNGQLLASASENKEIRVWNAANGGPAAKPNLAGFEAAVKRVAFTPDNLKAVGGDASGRVLMFNLQTGLAEQAFAENASEVVGLVSAGEQPTGMVAAFADKAVRRWQPLLLREVAGHTAPVAALETVPTTPTQFVSGAGDNTVRIWESSNGAMVRQMNHAAPVKSVAVRADGQQIASAGGNAIARLWNYANGQQVAELRGDSRLQWQATRATTQNQVATNLFNAAKAAFEAAGKDKTAKEEASKKAVEALAAAEKTFNEKKAAYDKAKGDKDAADKVAAEAKTKLDAATAEAEKAKVALDAKADDEALKQAKAAADKAVEDAKKVLADAEAKVKPLEKPLADAEKAKTDAEAPFNNARRSAEQAADDLKRSTDAVPVAEAAQKKAEAAAEVAKAALEAAQKAAAEAEAPIVAVAFSPDGQEVATAGEDKLVHTFSTLAGQPLTVLAGQTGPIAAVAFTADGQIASAAQDKSIVVWDAYPQYVLERTLGGSGAEFIDRVIALDFAPDGKLLATGGGEPSRTGELKLWNVETGDLVREIAEAHSDTVFSIDFSYDGTMLASGAADKFVKTFDVASGSLLKSFEGHTHHVLGVGWQYDGAKLASAGADNVIKIWNFTTGEQERTIQGFSKQLTSLEFIGITNEILSGCGDKVVHRRRTDGGAVRTYPGATDYVYSTAVNYDGKVIVGGGQDSVLRVWNGDNAQPLRTFEPPQPPQAPAAAEQAGK